MALARLIEQLLKQGKSGDEIQSCFTSLLEVSIRLKEARDGKDEQGSDDAEGDSDNEEDEDDDTDNDDYDEVDVWSAFTRENASNTLSNTFSITILLFEICKKNKIVWVTPYLKNLTKYFVVLNKVFLI